MQSKVFRSGGSFGRVCQYVCQDQDRARILEIEGVRKHDLKLMAADFESQQQRHPERNKAVFHSTLTFPPGEKPSDQLMTELARKYLDRVGLGNTQYVVTRHTDTDHAHLHLIANWVDNNGESISAAWIGFKGQKAARELTLEYGLTETLKKNLELTHREKLNASDARRYRIYEAIQGILPGCTSLTGLEQHLSFLDIETRYRYPEGENNGEPIGISFRLENECFKGSKIDKDFSIKELQKTLDLQRQQELKRQLEHQLSLERERQQRLKLRHPFEDLVENKMWPRRSRGMHR